MGRRPSGLALVIVIGVLGVVAVLATGFVTIAQLERRASQRRIHQTRAHFLSRSGIEDALARLAQGQDPEFARSRYGGEDWDADAILDPLEASAEAYGPGVLDRDACPVAQAMRPSFSVLGPADPVLRPVDGRSRGYSGRLAGEAPAGVYALKVTSGGFHLNGGDPTQPASMGYNAVLQRMLGILAREIGGGVAQADGLSLISQRPVRGWTSFAEVRELALGGSQAKLDALKPYLTLQAWTDKRVIAPNVAAALGGRSYACWGDLKLDHANPPGSATRAPLFERMPPAPAGRVVGRAPVELAWARTRRPALVALLEGLQGLYLDEGVARVTQDINDYSLEYSSDAKPWPIYAKPGSIDSCGALKAVSLDAARTTSAANAFLSTTSDLSTWQRFQAFCDTVPFAGTNTTDLQALRDVIKANFNPNSDLNKFNPCRGMWKHVDKSDLLAYSTEFSLAPIQSRRVESLGLVLDASGRVLARRRLEVVVAPPGVARLATQKELVCEDLGSLDVAGDERIPRLPGYSINNRPAFLTPSRGGTDPTWGHAVDTTVLSPSTNYDVPHGNWMTGASRGVSLQTYPEPCFDTTPNPATPPTLPDVTMTKPSINPAEYAGSLQLATLETPKDAFYTAGGDVRRMTLLARFDDGFDLDDWEVPNTSRCLIGSRQVSTAELGLGVWCSNVASKLNTLYPDGAYCEARRAPSYWDRGNSDGFHGTMSFWVKPNYNLPYASGVVGPDPCWRSHPFVMRSSENMQYFFVGDGHGRQANWDFRGLGLMFEQGSNNADFMGNAIQEQSFPAGKASHHAWQLVTAGWDFLSPLRPDTGEFIVDDGQGGKTCSNGDYKAVAPYIDSLWPASTDITLDTVGAVPYRHRMCLGAMGNGLMWSPQQTVAPGADATIDELVIYDFGGAYLTADLTTATTFIGSVGVVAAPGDSLSAPRTLAAERYHAGRYHKGSVRAPAAGSPYDPSPDVAWVSGPIRLPEGSRIQEIRWTWHSPTAVSSDYAEVELLQPDLSGYLGTEGASRSVLAPGWAPPPGRTVQSWKVSGPPGGTFRIRATFRREDPATVTDSIPILESPVLDDLTLLYLPPGGPGLLSFGDE